MQKGSGEVKAKEYLQQLKKLDVLISNKLIEIDQWKAIASGTTACSEGERVQASGSQQKMADAVVRYMDIQGELDADIDRFIDTKMDVIRTIETLNPTEYDLLHMVYVQFLTLDDVAAKYDKSYSWATSVKGRAMANVQRILDERETKAGDENT